MLPEQPSGERYRFLRLEKFRFNNRGHPYSSWIQMDCFVVSLLAMTDSS
jgi:hypothetical protein